MDAVRARGCLPGINGLLENGLLCQREHNQKLSLAKGSLRGSAWRARERNL